MNEAAMTSRDDPNPARTEALRMEAAEWFARMRREDSNQFKPAFEAWLADPEHRRTYNRLASRFSDAKVLRRGTSDTPVPPVAGKRRIGLAALVIATLALLALAFMFAVPKMGAARWPVQTARLEGSPTVITRFRLRDGSVITLDRDALVNVALDGDARTLRLERGRARFAVAHEDRPFTVEAGAGSIVARGTIFDVTFASGRADVALIEGAIDVTPQRAGAAEVRRLHAGQSVALDRGRIDERPAAAGSATDWPRTMIQIRDETLDSLLARANRLSVIQIDAADGGLGAIRLSGRFRLDDPEHLSANLARLLDLEFDRHGTHIILSRRGR